MCERASVQEGEEEEGRTPEEAAAMKILEKKKSRITGVSFLSMDRDVG